MAVWWWWGVVGGVVVNRTCVWLNIKHWEVCYIARTQHQ